MKLKVKSAQLHQPIDVRGFITKKTITPSDLQGCTLEFDTLGLHVTFRNSLVIIPAANVAAVTVDGQES